MLKINGAHNSAIIYANAVEMAAEDQILQYLNDPIFANTKVRIMPDVHAGEGVVIGFTATQNEYVVPSMIGVDIGCGVNAYNIGSGSIVFDKLDEFIRKRIPAGKEVNNSPLSIIDTVYNMVSENDISFNFFTKQIDSICNKVGMDTGRAMASLGSLGGGNHFIEIDKDENKNRWLLIHTGSRGFGMQVARYHQNLANKNSQTVGQIKYLMNQAAENYLEDMQVAQIYARLNRALIAYQISTDFFKLTLGQLKVVESVHNYIDFEHKIIRKGAISAQKGEDVVIPFSMSEGAIIGVGKGNIEWNFSAPHGAGRKMSRTRAKSLSMDEYRKRTKDIWSSCINECTIDESPMAYKPTKDILESLNETVHITNRLVPVYNFKASE